MEDRILRALENKPYKINKLAKKLNVNKDELKKVLKQLLAAEKIYRYYDEYYLVLKGKLEVTNDRFGFITPEIDSEEKVEDFYVASENFNGALDGDIVLFFVYKDYGNKYRANVIKVVEHTKLEIIGIISLRQKKTGLVYKICSRDGKETYTLLGDNLKETYNNAIAKADLIYGKNNHITARLSYIIGYKDDPGIEISTIAATYGFPIDFPDEVKDEVAGIPTAVLPEELEKREDFTALPIITIDGDDSKDFDDAIYVKKLTDNTYTLGVYIADVSHYVTFSSPLDKEAYKRGTSVYLADRVIPMLPRELSNGICSLNEGVNRLVLAIIMQVDAKGRVLDSKITEGVIKSRHRMTYNKVNQILEGNEGLRSEYADIDSMLIEANELHKIIRSKREKEGSLDFDIPEYSFILNPDGSPKQIVTRTRYDAEKLIEDFMILANEEIAKHMTRLDLPFLYRIHDKPDEEKMNNFFAYMGDTSAPKKNKNGLNPKQVQQILKSIEDNPQGQILNQLLLRSMAKAKYSSQNIGHYGLALKNYCHFTSPIRRYPDLIVHRIIKELILHPEHYEKCYRYYASNLEEIGLRTSIRERNAIECEREVNDMLYAWYMESHLKEIHTGVISSITNFGMFVTIEDGIEGLIHIKNLKGLYHFEEKKLQLVGYNHTFSIGETVDIVVIGADRVTKKIDFMLKDDYLEEQKFESSRN